MPAILIVCTANVCRSPMAEAILKKILANQPDADQWHVESAGTWATDGREPAFLSKYVMEKMGMDISEHRSQSITLRMLEKFDLLLTMEEDHKRWLADQYRDYADRTYMLSEMVGQVADISDPINGELSDYAETAALLQRLLTEGLDEITRLAQHEEE
ncbi:MAG: low molecular weight protein arginine phosphatase [Anaerolineae bacterium]|nr:low molecular weight protein arginine phosphatase [Anaerolineae bacterium]